MSVPPSERPAPPPPPPGEPPPERVEVERKSSSPLVWLLLLIALLAIGWYFYSQRGPSDAPAEPVTPIGETEIGDGSPPPPASETPAGTAPAATTPAAPSGPATQSAEPLARVEPSYPAAALRSREEGTVVLRVEVDAQGNPTSVDVERSSRSRDLDRAARDAVRQWTFSPAVENGQPVASTVSVPVDFRIEDQ